MSKTALKNIKVHNRFCTQNLKYGYFSVKRDDRFIRVYMAYNLLLDYMLQNMNEIGENVKICVMLSKKGLLTELVTDGTRTILVQFTPVYVGRINNEHVCTTYNTFL